MAIDEFFGCRLGELPYRSLRFHHKTVSNWDDQPYSVRNYTDTGRFTREAWWHCLPGHLQQETGRRTVTVEEPCDYRDNGNERYYPVKTADGRYQALYQDYRALAGDAAEHGVHRPLRHLPVSRHGSGDQPVAGRGPAWW